MQTPLEQNEDIVARGGEAYIHEGSSHTGDLLHHGTALERDGGVDSGHRSLRARDLHEEHGLQHAGLRCERCGIDGTARGGDHLASSTVDGVRMQHHVHHLHHAAPRQPHALPQEQFERKQWASQHPIAAIFHVNACDGNQRAQPCVGCRVHTCQQMAVDQQPHTAGMHSRAARVTVAHLERRATHVLLTHGALLTGPLERSHDGVLDFTEVLHGLGGVDHEVGAHGVRPEAPDLLREVLVPSKVIHQLLATNLDIVL